MLAINKLIRNNYAWTNILQNRFERAAKEIKADVIFYPEKDYWLEDAKEDHAVAIALLHESVLWLRDHTKDVSDILFTDLDYNIFPQVGMIERYNEYIPYRSLIHCDAEVGKFYEGLTYYLHLVGKLDTLIFQLKTTEDSYKHFGIRSQVIGGFLEHYNNEHLTKKFDVLWTGHRINDPGKGFPLFEKILAENPSLQFFAAISFPHIPFIMADNILSSSLLQNDALLEVSKKSKFVLSTSVQETFGYTMMNAVAVGCIPLALDIPAHRELFPRKFLFTDRPDFTITATDSELEEIVERHYYADSFRRFIAS